jgi:thiamine-phosphate pyrophosphorylase
MSNRCLLYYVTDRSQFSGDERTRRRVVLDKIAEAAGAGVDYIQLREKDLPVRELESLAREAVRLIRDGRPSTKNEPRLATRLLINSRTDIALAAQADGVHLRSDDVSPRDVRKVVSHAGYRLPETDHFCIAVSCHSPSDVRRAQSGGADFAVFAPVFEKKNSPETIPQGLAALHEACRMGIAVLALGGITLENAHPCLEAGAAGIAGIRLFQQNKISDVVRALRSF